jgi:hypothetical protein
VDVIRRLEGTVFPGRHHDQLLFGQELDRQIRLGRRVVEDGDIHGAYANILKPRPFISVRNG